jgi:acyl dehydratase
MSAENSHITAEIRDLLGKETPPLYLQVEKGDIRRWAQAVGDSNPQWTDDEYARKSKYGHVVAPPTFLIDRAIVPLADKVIAIKGATSFLNGGTEVEYFKPIEVGDILATTAKMIDVKEKVSGSRALVIMVLEMTYKNQKGELVRIVKNTFIRVHEGQEKI